MGLHWNGIVGNLVENYWILYRYSSTFILTGTSIIQPMQGILYVTEFSSMHLKYTFSPTFDQHRAKNSRQSHAMQTQGSTRQTEWCNLFFKHIRVHVGNGLWDTYKYCTGY